MENETGQDADLPHRDLVLAVYIITFIAGVPANLLALVAFTRKVRQKPTPIDIFLLNLTVSDLIFLFFLIFKMKEAADYMEWHMPYFLCPLSSFLFYSTIYNSTFFLTAVSVERYLGVAFPIKYKLKRRPVNAIVASVLFWVISLSNCSVVFFMQYFKPANSSQIKPHERLNCYMDFSTAQLDILMPVRLELFLALFCVPFLICCFCYINFIRILSRMPNIGLPKRQRAIGMALGTLLVFAFCFAPYNISHVVGFVNWSSPRWRVYALLLSTFNACLDPLIFYFSSSAVRGMLRRILRPMFGWLWQPCARDKAQCYPHIACMATEESTQCSNETS